MAGAILERELTAALRSRVEFDVASEADDGQIRRLLRENPMPGGISLSLEREPNYFADSALSGETKQTIVARDQGQIVCAGACTIRQRFVNGTPCRVGYLGGLRLDASASGRFDLLRRGYEFFHELQSADPADFYFTSIACDNQRARGFLERGVRGMPLYDFIGEFVTVLISTRDTWKTGHPRSRTSGTVPADKLIPRLSEHNRARQFAPCWQPSELAGMRRLGLELTDFFFLQNGESEACAAIWDQRSFKQTVIRNYAGGLAQVRPLFNLWARLTNHPRLPVVGSVLANGFVSHLAVSGNDNVMKDLVSELCLAAKRRGIELLTLGFAANEPKLHILRRHFRCREYRSRLYVVRWADIGGAASELDHRLLDPEVGLL